MLKIITLDVEIYNDKGFFIYKEYNSDKYRIIDLLNKQKIKAFLDAHDKKKAMLFGFNIKRYDILIIVGSLLCENFEQIKTLNNLVLSENKQRKKDQWWITNSRKIYEIINNLLICDIYLMNGWDDDSKRASLKWVCCNLNKNNIVETPVSFTENITHDSALLKKCIEYCKNDVKETESLLEHFRVMIKGRHQMYKKYKNERMLSCDNTTVGYYIIKHFIEAEGITMEKKQNFPPEHQVPVKQVIFPYIKIENKLINENIQTKKIYIKGENDFKFTAPLVNRINKIPFLQNTMIDFGVGGGHGCYGNYVYESDENYTIISFDVASYYPSIVIENELYIKQIGPAFRQVYKNIKEERFKYPKSDPNNLYLKETLNAIVGLSNNMESDFYDPYFFYSVTLNGQLILYWICETILKHTESRVLLFNTDGCEIMINRKDIPRFYEIMDMFVNQTKLKFEYKEYKKLIVANVNNYIALYKTGTEKEGENTKIDLENPPDTFFKNGKEYSVKTKGIIFNLQSTELHKNNGGKIYKKALINYYIHNIPISDSIYNNNNLIDYLIFVRKNNNTCIVYFDGKKYIELPNRVIRYVYGQKNNNISKLYRKGKNGYVALNKSNRISEHIIDYIDKYDISIVNKISYLNHLKNVINNMIDTKHTLF